MKYLWIGILFGPELESIIKSKNVKLMSSYVSQKALIEGLDSLNVDMDSINSIQLDPRIIKTVKQEAWTRNSISQDYSIGYKNIKFFNHFLRQKELVKAAKKWAHDNKGQEVMVVVFQMHSPFLKAALAVKKILPTSKITLIVPDLPQYMDLSMSALKKVLKRIDWYNIKKLIKKVDKYVLYAKPMSEFLKLDEDKWTVIEGIYDSKLVGSKTDRNDNKTVVMYSGVLDNNYGIPELLDSFDLLDDSFELWLTGDGNSLPLIEEKAKNDSRIHYFGYFSSRQELLDKQASADILISPRKKELISSKYCFPSKLFEYLASGNPVISCYLDGIPSEYYKYLIELKEVSKECIAQTIVKVSKMNAYEKSKLKASEILFVRSNKNKEIVAKKFLEFICND